MDSSITEESADRKGNEGKGYVTEGFWGELFGAKNEDEDSRHDEA